KTMRYHWRMMLGLELPMRTCPAGNLTGEVGSPGIEACANGYRRSSTFIQPLLLEDAVHLGGAFVEQRLGVSLAEQATDDGLAECDRQLVRFRMEVRGRHRLREHGFGGLMIGQGLHVAPSEVRRHT